MTESLEKSNEYSKSSKKPGQDIASLKNQLNKSYKAKEEWFKKKEDLKKDLNNLISKIKTSKSKLDNRNSEVVKLKKERDSHNKKVSELISKIKKYVRLGGPKKEDPDKIKEEIEKLEKRAEFMAIDFAQEKKIMKQLKELRKKYSEAIKGDESLQNVKKISGDIDEAKEKSNQSHKKIVDITKKGKDYKEFIELSKKINFVKKEQEDAFDKFVQYKNEYAKVNDLLKTKLVEQSKLAREKPRKTKREKAQMDLEEKRRLVEEKVRQGKKLTTDDLILFQEE